MKPSIFIGLPAYRGDFHAKTAVSLMTLACSLERAEIAFTPFTLDINDIAESRNALASIFLHKTAHSHILMIDADMTLKPSAVAKMLQTKSGVVACAAPRRSDNQMNFASVGTSNSRIGEAARIGAGIILISRDALVSISKLPELRRTTHDPKFIQSLGDASLYGFFDRTFSEDGVTISEDYSFCDRWRQASGQMVKVILDEEIGHIGDRHFSTKLKDLKPDHGVTTPAEA